MTNGPTILVDLIVVSSLVRLVAEKMDFSVVNATKRFLSFEVL